MTKPSRWAHGTFCGEPWRWSLRGYDVDIEVNREYYRRLCAYYISEARRWMMIARDEARLHEVHHAEEFVDDTFEARMEIAEEFMRDMGGTT